jgi:zinc/manganese transport system substrate-binding protein
MRSVHRASRRRRSRSILVGTAALAVSMSGLAGCSSDQASTSTAAGVIQAVGAENQYADVLQQIGGRYVSVTSILDNPNTDPHTFEASTRVAEEVAEASLVVQNGIGYDTFMNQIEAASPNPDRRVIVAQHVMRLPDDTPNPHLWYNPKTMPAVAGAMASALDDLAPAHRAYFQARLTAFDASLQPWLTSITLFRAEHAGVAVAVTEPVADYLLQAMGAKIVTPFSFQADIMNGVDPSPEAITREEGLFTGHVAKVFCYNQQVVSSLTASIRQMAQTAGIPVVGVYETMPTPGYDYQSWMEAEVSAIQAAVTHGTSTEQL